MSGVYGTRAGGGPDKRRRRKKMLPLSCAVKTYDWGVPGDASLVAQLRNVSDIAT